MQTLPWKMSQPKNIFDTLDSPVWLCSGGRRTSKTLSISKQKTSAVHQTANAVNQEVLRVVKEQLITPLWPFTACESCEIAGALNAILRNLVAPWRKSPPKLPQFMYAAPLFSLNMAYCCWLDFSAHKPKQ